MANEKKQKVSKNKSLENKVFIPAVVSSPSTTMTSKKGSKNITAAKILHEEEHNQSSLEEDDEENREERESEDDEIDEEKNGSSVEWPKEDDVELFGRIRKSCPKDDSMKYDSRVNHLDWESIKFQSYSAEQCKARWLFVQTHLRHYRILTEVLDDAVSWVDRPWYNFNKGGKNNQKHPEQPKKPLTSYMLFYMEQKDSILEKQPGLGMTELSKVIAKMYHELNERKKQKYAELAEKEKEAYQLKMKKFLDDHPDYILPKSKQAKAVPPKAPTPFKLFCDAKLTKYLNEGLSLNEAREKCRDNFKELNDKQRLKWIYQSVEQENNYNEELEKFKADHPDVDISGKKQSLLTKDELLLKEKNEGKPEKPPNSGYSLFSKKLLSSDSLKHVETKERMTEISRMWKELSETEKALYNEEAQEMNYSYKMKYASYLETLTPEQRNAELVSSVAKGMKRPSVKKVDEVIGKKQKINTKVEIPSSDVSSDQDTSDEEDFEIPKKNSIQKPRSSLQMFCNTNMAKYSAKHPKLTKQELTRLMAKEFAKLSEDKKKIYGTMAQKSKSEISQSAKKPNPSVSPKSKVAKPPPATKKLTKPVASAMAKNPDRSTSSPSKKSSSEESEVKSPSKVKPSLNANVKSSSNKSSTKPVNKSDKNMPVPVWATNKTLFNANEPPKPPETPSVYYAMIHHSKSGQLSAADIENIWKQLSEKRKKKIIEEHKKKQKEYVSAFENFVRTLSTGELKYFRSFMKNREKEEAKRETEEEDDDSKSSTGEENSLSSNENNTSDEEPQLEMSSDDD